MSLLLRIACCTLCLISWFACKPQAPQEEDVFRVVGYLFSPRDWMDGLEQVNLDRVTDINFAFINIQKDGTYRAENRMTEAIALAKKHGKKVFLSLGGGSPPDHLHTFLTPDRHVDFVEQTVEFAVKMGFDGVDVDLENDLINDQYGPLVSALGVALKAKGKEMTAALASWNANRIADGTLADYDRIHIMSYDQTGPWNLAKVGPHAPFEMAERDFLYFHQERGVPSHRLTIGLPFYGYGFGEGAPVSLTYKRLLELFPEAHESDEIKVTEGGTIYYNGEATITKKVRFAVEQGAGGVMIWHLNGDHAGERSLLARIQLAIQSSGP